MLACHGGAGRQSVWKDEKKSCLETMMNLWEINFDFVTVPVPMRVSGFFQ